MDRTAIRSIPNPSSISILHCYSNHKGRFVHYSLFNHLAHLITASLHVHGQFLCQEPSSVRFSKGILAGGMGRVGLGDLVRGDSLLV